MVLTFCSDALEAYRFVMKDPRAKHNTLGLLRTGDPVFDACDPVPGASTPTRRVVTLAVFVSH